MRFILVAISLIGSFASADISNQKCKEIEAQLREGDIAFINVDTWLYRKVAAATKSWTTHVGIVLKEKDKWIVAESSIPFSKKTPFCKFIQHTSHDQYSIRRIGHTEFAMKEMEQIKSLVNANMGRFYDLYFNYDSPRLFCSKFVYDLIKDTTGMEIGQVETLDNIRKNNPTGDTTFWEYWFLGNVPWQQRTITPQSMYEDAKLITISENL